MALTKPNNNITQNQPADSRRITHTQYTASNTQPSSVSPTGSFEVGDQISVTLVVSSDDATGDGNAVNIDVWRYRRIAGDDPLGGGATYYWSKGETIPIADLGYDESSKEFQILTNECEKIYYQIASYPGGVAWINCDTYVGIPRRNSLSVLSLSQPTAAAASTSSNVVVTNTPLPVSNTVLTDIHDAVNHNIEVANDVLTDIHDPVNNNIEVANDALTDVWDSVSSSFRMEEIDPIYGNHVELTLADVTDGANDTYNYFVDMDTFRKVGLQFILLGGAATGGGETGVTDKCYMTIQDDGTAAVSCAYEDVTNDVFGTPSLVAAPNTAATDAWLDNSEALSLAKYVKIEVVADCNGATGDWTIYCKKLY